MKPTMFNHNKMLEYYLDEVNNMSYDELCVFIHKAYQISYELGVLVSEKLVMCDETILVSEM